MTYRRYKILTWYVLLVCINKEHTVVNWPIYNGTTFWHGPIILGSCFWLFWFSGSKPATARTKRSKQFNHVNGQLPISRVTPLAHRLIPLSLGSSGWFSKYCPMKIVRIFYRINARYGRYFYNLTRTFPNQQCYNKSTYDLVERFLFP